MSSTPDDAVHRQKIADLTVRLEAEQDPVMQRAYRGLILRETQKIEAGDEAEVLLGETIARQVQIVEGQRRLRDEYLEGDKNRAPIEDTITHLITTLDFLLNTAGM